MKKTMPTSLNKKVLDILEEELTPRMASVTDREPEEVMALSAAYMHASCMLMKELEMDQELFKLMLHDTVSYVWLMADGPSSGTVH
jgi:hypothetical protein